MSVRPDDAALAEIAVLFNRVVSKLERLDARARDFGTGEKLTRSEIHFIVYVGERPLSTVTELASKLGVTKGAVSQMHGKLARKGYIRILKPADGGRERLLTLTPRGEVARAGHERFHRAGFEGRLAGLTHQDLRAFRRVLVRVEGFVDGFLKQA